MKWHLEGRTHTRVARPERARWASGHESPPYHALTGRATPGKIQQVILSRVLVMAAVIAALAGRARGDDQQTTQITLHPAAAVQPALKYQLLPPFLELPAGQRGRALLEGAPPGVSLVQQ